MADAQGDSGSQPVESIELEEFLNSHGDRLLRSAYLLCGNETEAQDLVQETVVQAIKSWQRFRGNSAVYTWVHGILLNVSRRRQRKERRVVYDEELVAKEVLEASQAEAADADYCSTHLAEALQDLSPEHREVIVLRYYENLTLKEIASQTGMAKGTVKSRLHYAVRCLEQLLPKEMNLFASSGTHNRES